jgi:AcrR family transcriptional regulator
MAARKKTATKKGHAGSSYHHGDLRRGLLDASLEIIEREGVSSLTLRYAAREAGVSHAAPKHHFGDLRGLHCAIAEEGHRALRGYMERALAEQPDADPARALKIRRSPGHFRAMFHPKVADRRGQPELERAAHSTYGLLVDAVRRGQAAGQFRSGETSDIALAAWSLVHGLATLSIDNHLDAKGFSSSDPVEMMDHLTDFLGRGIGVYPS